MSNKKISYISNMKFLSYKHRRTFPSVDNACKEKSNKTIKKFVGSPADLPTSDLPTYQDVARFIYKLKDTGCIKDKQDILKIVSQELKKIWIKQ